MPVIDILVAYAFLMILEKLRGKLFLCLLLILYTFLDTYAHTHMHTHTHTNLEIVLE